MARLDLDDLPPRVAAQLTALAEGDELVVVQHGAVVARLTVQPQPVPAEDEPPAEPGPRMAEVFENFRASIEDEF
jgi:antitoxin (DNA-binding transcriptional repressor) of toxin-antitoxin stability system